MQIYGQWGREEGEGDYMTEITTIRVTVGTKENLNKWKLVERESHEDTLNRLLEMAEILQAMAVEDDEGELTDDIKRLISMRMSQVKRGKVLSTQELRTRLMQGQHEVRRSMD